MRQSAKLFMSGRSQAVRLPAAFRFDSKEVYIRKDPKSGDIILSRKPGSWEDFFLLIDQNIISADYMEDRDNQLFQERDLF